jgi:lipoprotein-anchoring transpeptidase ErfK/SrfK
LIATNLLCAAGVLTACSADNTKPGPTVTVHAPATTSSTTSSTGAPATSSTPPITSTTGATPPSTPVHVSSAVLSDGSQVGVGLPIIVLLSRPITDAKAFAAATKVTVNGKLARGGWFFERKYNDKGHPIEADYRLPNYWPGHAQIHLDLAVKGVSAGAGLVFANNLTLDFSTGAANVVTVDNSTHRLTVVSDGKQWPNAHTTFPVSLGATDTTTRRGVKVIMEKGNSICMHGPGYSDCGVRYTQRLTYDGEYLHAAPWNCLHSPGCIGPQHNIGTGNSSNGCTNLTPHDAQELYGFLGIGDVVSYPNADGDRMTLGDGYGDWNVLWSQWQTGGLYAVG